jgi:uncharacterized protein
MINIARTTFVIAGLTLAGTTLLAAADAKPARSFRALLVTGGCCHNYNLQTRELTNAVAKLASVEWTVVNEGGNGTKAQIPLYANPDWAKGFDVVVHNECFADTTDSAYIRSITSAHKAGTAAVVIHCAMHTYRSAAIDDWRELLGVTSRRHDHLANYPVKKVDAGHVIVKELPENWITPKDELYIIEKLWPNARALATSKSEVDGREHPVIWTNQYGTARVFGTTFGHSDATFRDPVFLGYLARGIVWAANR